MDTNNNFEELKVFASRKRYILVVFYLLMVSYILLLTSMAQGNNAFLGVSNIAATLSAFPSLFGLFALGYLLCIPVNLKNIIRRTPIIIINKDGFYYDMAKKGVYFFKWEDISKVAIKKLPVQGNFLGIDVYTNDERILKKYMKKVYFLNYYLCGCLDYIGISKINIKESSVTTPLEEIANLMNKYLSDVSKK